MGDKLMAKVRADGKSIRTLTVKVRYNDMDEEQASESLDEPTDLETEIYSEITRLLRKAWKRRVSLRLVSLKLSNIYEGRFRGLLALDAPARQHEAQQRLADIVDELREKFGRGVLLRGHDFVLSAVAASPPESGSRLPQAKTFGTTTRLRQRLRFGVRQPSAAFPPADAPLRQGEPKTYGLAVVQRQRLGNSLALLPPEAKKRQITSPGAEFRFRASQPTICRPHSSFVIRHSSFRPLNVHSYYSFLDSTLSINAIIDLAKRYELPAIALTDKNNLHGAVEFSELAARAGIKPILGAEIEWQGTAAVPLRGESNGVSQPVPNTE